MQVEVRCSGFACHPERDIDGLTRGLLYVEGLAEGRDTSSWETDL